MGRIALPGAVKSLQIVGSLAYVASSVGGLHTVDLSDPAHPVLLGSLDTPGYALRVLVVGDVAYVSDYTSVLVASVGTPSDLHAVGSLNTPGFAWGIADVGHYLLVADDDAGLEVLFRQCPGATAATQDVMAPRSSQSAITVRPCPVRTTATIALHTGRSDPLEVTLFDACGRRVRRLAAGMRGSGPQRIEWNGYDESGRRVPSGIYYVHVAPLECTPTRFVVVR